MSVLPQPGFYTAKVTGTTPVQAMRPSEQHKHIAALDGLRGMAVLLVLADHLLWSNSQVGSNRFVCWLAAQHDLGWIGVDAFFVLSGFLITGILIDSRPQEHFFRNFYARRTLRIFPLYYGFLFLVILTVQWQGKHWSSSLGLLLTYVENLPLHQLPQLTNAGWVNLNHFWSLAIEEQFYLFWPLLVFLLRTPKRVLAAAALGAAFSIGVRLSLWHTPLAVAQPYVLYSWTPARLDELFAGAMLAVLVRGRHRVLAFSYSRATLGMALGLLLVLDVFYPGLQFVTEPGLLVWLPILLAVMFASLILEAIRHGSAVQRLFQHATLRFFGRYSYGLYVYHYTLATLVMIPLRNWMHLHFHSRALGVVVPAAITLTLTVILAMLSYHLYEKHFLRLKRYFAGGSPARAKLRQVTPVGGTWLSGSLLK